MKRKIIFLDIDGVLNSVDSMIAFQSCNEYALDKVSIGLLKSLCEITGADIVVSSTWRMGRDKKDFMEIFSLHDWHNFPYVGQTRILDMARYNRGYEIKEWLSMYSDRNGEYIIIDDDSDMLPEQLDRFIHVSSVNGFRSKHYCQALRLFGHPDEKLEQQVNWVKGEMR